MAVSGVERMFEITYMKITGITLENFRNHTASVHYDFGDVSTISGHNGVGKTTMAHAVCYALYGVSYTGEQKIERLMHENADSVKVSLDFIDQNGKEHTLLRSRWRDKTSLTLDSYTIQQTAIDKMFGERDMFLSMFNPTYLTECMKNNGRELILSCIPPVSKEEILKSLPEWSCYLENMPLEHETPEELLKQTRAGIRRAEQQSDILEGHIESFTQTRDSSEHKLETLYSEKKEIETEVSRLKAKRSEGIDVKDIEVQQDVLSKKLASIGDNSKVDALREKLHEAKNRVYVSELSKPFAEAQAEYNALGKQYKQVAERLKTVKVGDTCPTCKMSITEQNIEGYKQNLSGEIGRLAELGKGTKERLTEISELDKKAKEKFEEFRADDIAKYTAEIDAMASVSSDRKEILAELNRLEDLEKNGNLTDEEVSKLRELEMTLTGVNAQINAIEETTDKDRLTALLAEKNAFEEQIETSKNTVTALSEYIFKRAELAAEKLDMPNVKIRLFDVVRTTGEVKNVFKFNYKGREYSSLSLSEKTLAGMEICAMLRNLTGKDYPICVDNTESIAAFGDSSLPSQVLLLRVVKGQPLTVNSQNRAMQSKAA